MRLVSLTMDRQPSPIAWWPQCGTVPAPHRGTTLMQETKSCHGNTQQGLFGLHPGSILSEQTPARSLPVVWLLRTLNTRLDHKKWAPSYSSRFERSLFGFDNWVTTLGELIVFMWDTQEISSHVNMLMELIAYMTWHEVMWSRWRRSMQDLVQRTGCKSEGQVIVTWRRRTKATVKSKWSQDRWTNMIMWWYGVDHIIIDHVGTCVASTLGGEGMECARQMYNHRAFYFTGHRCVEKLMIGFMIDGHTIKRGKHVCISVI
jgi:hypothetical protein